MKIPKQTFKSNSITVKKTTFTKISTFMLKRVSLCKKSVVIVWRNQYLDCETVVPEYNQRSTEIVILEDKYKSCD